MYLFNIIFEEHLIEVRRAFAPKELFDPHENGGEALDAILEDETTHLKQDKDDSQDHLPLWTQVNMEEFYKNRSRFVKWLVGGQPNQQQTFYWFDRKGPKCYLLILQSNLLFTGIYFAMNILGFLKVMWAEGIVIFSLYVILASLPFIGMTFFKQHLVSVLSQVCCMGAYRRPNMVTEVLREEKTAHLVRAFIVIYKMRIFARNSSRASFSREVASKRRQTFDEFEIREVAKTFDAFDPSGDGAISHQEFEDLMTNLGTSMKDDAASIKQMIDILDEDGNGEVSREEFIDWYAHNAGDEDVKPHERALYLFRLFDPNETGEITIGEFKRKLDALNVGFTIDEVGAIVNELDDDNSGTIGLHEFCKLLDRYHPEELRADSEKKPWYKLFGIC